ncbi:MAG: hypothetical protein BRC40_14305 [Cyanobacteria bacterium QH_8_48_120]|nr:MAG: hypothetical protein BRC40_14305 [Cyanobacteria bacterium QH_8_48_120]
MNPPVFDNRPLVVMCCGDNDEAKQQIAVWYPYSFDFNTPKSKGDLNKNQHTIYAVFIHS